MKIIGHRGAAGLELENTLASIRKAKSLGVDAIEVDVRLTKDRKLVLCHDADVSRVSSYTAVIRGHSLKELRQLTLHNGETLPTLAEALKLVGTTPIIIEAKDADCALELLAALDTLPQATVSVTTFQHSLGAQLEALRPTLTVYLAEHFKPVEVLSLVHHAKANGLTLNAWLLNPYTYWVARRRKLDLMVYTVDSRFVGNFIKFFYPKVMICTNHPERFIGKRKLRSKQPQV